jgi:hypothetical protein
MSRQKSPTTKIVKEDERIRKAKRTRSTGPTLADFPRGRRIAGEHHAHNGYLTRFDLEIVDAYEDVTCTQGDFAASPIIVFARVLSVTSERASHLVGHIVRVHLARTSWRRDIFLTAGK